MKIEIGQTKAGATISLPLARANRHGLITGSTGGGKTVTLQRLAEEFSTAGVPVFAADVKGDLSGVAAAGDAGSALTARCASLGRQFVAKAFPVQFWDLFGHDGLPIRTSVHAMGPELLGRMLRLNETQQGALSVLFKRCEDNAEFKLTLDDLRWALDDLMENREDVSKRYGHITAASIATIQRNLLALEVQGGGHLFGEPPFDIMDLIRTAPDGRGIINLLAADQLMECPKLYAVFLLWLLTELFRVLPEAGDLDKPKLVFFFDEAHLLFSDAPKELVQQVERLVRLVRSKGVGVYFVTQSPADIPDTVLAQLGSRIQHALRAYTPKDQRMVKAAAQAFRENRGIDVKAEITSLAVGEALISVLDEAGIPTKVEKVDILPPSGQVGPISTMERRAIMDGSGLRKKYAYDLPEGEASTVFNNRMRRDRGLPELVKTGDWQPGDFRQFVPSFVPEAPAGPSRWDHLRGVVVSGIIAAGGLTYLTWLVG